MFNETEHTKPSGVPFNLKYLGNGFEYGKQKIEERGRYWWMLDLSKNSGESISIMLNNLNLCLVLGSCGCNACLNLAANRYFSFDSYQFRSDHISTMKVALTPI